MRGAHDGGTAITLNIHERQVPLTACGVETRRGLVKQQQVGTAARGLRKVHALALPARQRAKRHISKLLNSEGGHRVVHVGLIVGAQPP